MGVETWPGAFYSFHLALRSDCMFYWRNTNAFDSRILPAIDPAGKVKHYLSKSKEFRIPKHIRGFRKTSVSLSWVVPLSEVPSSVFLHGFCSCFFFFASISTITAKITYFNVLSISPFFRDGLRSDQILLSPSTAPEHQLSSK